MSTAQQLRDHISPWPSIVITPVEAQWYAIYTRARHEKTVAAQLLEKQLTTFLPLISHVHRWSDRRQLVTLPLLPGYVFVRVVYTSEARLSVLRTPGVVRFVGINGKGLPIPDKQIEDIRTILANNVSCALYPFLRVGQRVRIRGGCLDGIEGILVARNSDRSLVISIEPIHRSMAMRIEGYDVELI